MTADPAGSGGGRRGQAGEPTPPVRFLATLSQALSSLTLYGTGHPSREGAVDRCWEALGAVLTETPRPVFSFLGEEVVFGRRPLRELRSWEWGPKLARVGVERLEFAPEVSREEMDAFVEELARRIGLTAFDATEAEELRLPNVHFGGLGVSGMDEERAEEVPTATFAHSFREEAEATRWVHAQAGESDYVPSSEAEAVVRSLSVAMHGEAHLVLPLLHLKETDQYTATHSINVSVLSMALAEYLSFPRDEIRAVGEAGLLHDVGKTRLPPEVLAKPGKLTPDEMEIVRQHPEAGARILLQSGSRMELAAVVAYEHHVRIDGGGYPALHYARPVHRVTRLVQVCDVYDALRTRRPFRDPWPAATVTQYIAKQSGALFDPEIVGAFGKMIRQWEPSSVALEDT